MRLYNLQTFTKHGFLLSLKNNKNIFLPTTQVLQKKSKNLNGILFLVNNFDTLYFDLTIVFGQLVVTKNNHLKQFVFFVSRNNSKLTVFNYYNSSYIYINSF